MNRAVFISITLAAFALSVFATKAAGTKQLSLQSAMAGTIELTKSSCEQQAWPRFSQDCLMSISGKKSKRQFRIVSY